ncbi:FMN-dependent NADH-azoreductase [Streptomyces sp. WSLK1-3]|uniref:FMN-dependent NADH-azoreductase n=1 Tax=Streptomyces sp. WSLK1-3 TaxID=3375475 RepID=UPI003797E271
MDSLLHIVSSPRATASQSLALADVFLDAYRETHPTAVVETFDLWNGTLPALGPTAVAARASVLAGRPLGGLQAEVWNAVTEVFEQFAGHRRYLFSVPVWNGDMPYVLKQFIDVVSQPGLLYQPGDEVHGTLTERRAAVIRTSGGWGPAPVWDESFRSPLEAWLRWTGIDDIGIVSLCHDTDAPGAALSYREAANKARAMGLSF